MKEYKRMIKSTLISAVIIFFLVVMKLMSFTNLNDPNNSDICWNIVTVNSVFAGFMFTSLSMLISVIFSDTVKRLERASLMEEVYRNILCGIYCSLLSIGFALIIIFILPNVTCNTALLNLLKSAIPFLMVYTLILSILCFLYSVLDVRFIIKDLRARINKGSVSEERKKEILKKIK